jgi:hypothetical protein
VPQSDLFADDVFDGRPFPNVIYVFTPDSHPGSLCGGCVECGGAEMSAAINDDSVTGHALIAPMSNTRREG